ncbi:Hypothetical protein A7982_05160 [Minicystis rosea]|nr:Hypothetical protein A7982_05160 [Minicystis rosea]
MISSPWDGASRRPLRTVLALLAAGDAVALTIGVATNPPSSISHPLAPRLLLSLGGHPERVAPLALVTLFALHRFAASAAAIGPGIVALASLALLCETHAALIEGPMRIFFATGATLVGWLAGLGYARLLGHRRDDGESERLAEMGAVAALCATYAGAIISKLWVAGFSWADAQSLRALIFSQRGILERSPFDVYALTVASQPSLAWALAAFTMVIQLGALIYPLSRRTRAICGTLLLGFHINVWMLTPILFTESMILLVAFSYPWPRWIGRLGAPAAAPATEAPSRARIHEATLRAAAFVLVLAGIAALLPVRTYTSLHHHRSSFAAREDGAPATNPEVRAWLGGLQPGDLLAGYRVEAIRGPRAGSIDVQVSRDGTRFDLSVIRHGSRDIHAPRSVGPYDILYGNITPPEATLSDDDVNRVLGALGDRLKLADGQPAPAGL